MVDCTELPRMVSREGFRDESEFIIILKANLANTYSRFIQSSVQTNKFTGRSIEIDFVHGTFDFGGSGRVQNS